MTFVCLCVCVSVCLCVCLSLDNLSISTPIVFHFGTVVEVLSGQTSINSERHSPTTNKMARLLEYVVVILTSLLCAFNVCFPLPCH